uniref:Uncharacterized protein LOC101506938 n=1 Tax=Cicer arietinum TaxID=3827 RepID=A0A1S3EI63_CICAR|nr:uncharacterized protein LOC101506938 [Cicer arietinum]
MIVDGCFLLELLIRLGDYTKNQTTTSYNNDIIFKTEEKVLSVLNDVIMLANQIPYLVLKKLYRKVFPDGSEIKDDHRVADIVRKAFGYPSVNSSGGAHILHLMHLSTVDQNQQHEGKKAEIELLRCATRLRASGIATPSVDSEHSGCRLVDRSLSRIRRILYSSRPVAIQTFVKHSASDQDLQQVFLYHIWFI